MQGGLIKTTDATGKMTVETFATRQKRFTQAFQRYARRHGCYVNLVRTCTRLRNEALAEAGIS